MASRVAIHRKVAARVLTRGMARGMAAELERVLDAGVCSRCGVWRCPHCRWLVVYPSDHKYGCRLYRHASPEAAP